MSDLDNIISGTITATSSTPTRSGFGKPCLMAYHTHNVDKWRDYASLADMVSDSFTSKEPAYRMAQSAFQQSPRPKTVRIGRMTTAEAQVAKLSVTNAGVAGTITSVNITDDSGVVHAISHTSGGVETQAAIATALGLLIAAIAGVASATAVGSDVTVTLSTAGKVWYFSGFVNLTYLDQTPSATIDADLTSILADDDDFFGVAISVESAANNEVVAAWCESNKRFFVAHTQDDLEATSGAVQGPSLVGSAYDYTFPLFSYSTITYPAAGLLGRMLPKNPGSATFNAKTITGTTPDKLSATQKTELEAKGWSYYVSIKSRGVTRMHGKVASGQYADVILGIAWMESEIATGVFDLISQADKVDYDDAGIAQVCAVIRGVLNQAKSDTRKILDPGNGADVEAPFVLQPKVTDISSTDRANRLLPNIQFGGRLRGGVDAVTYQGTLSI